MGGLAKVSLPLRDSTMHRSEETLTRRLLRPSHEGNVERRESDGGEKGHHGVDEVASFPSPWRHADRRRRERIADEHLGPRFRGKARHSPRDTSGCYLCKSTWHQGRIDDMDACLAVEGHGLLMGATMMDMAGRQRVRGRTCALLSVDIPASRNADQCRFAGLVAADLVPSPSPRPFTGGACSTAGGSGLPRVLLA